MENLKIENVLAQGSAKISEVLNFVPTKVKVLFGDTELGIATAFHYEHESRPYFMTNWHVVTGRHPDSKKLVAKHQGIPNRLRVSVPQMIKSEKGKAAKVDLGWKDFDIDLYTADGRAKWLEHPTLRGKVDAVAVPVGGLEVTEFKFANSTSGVSSMRLMPGMDIFVLGYPKGITGGGRLPIWKRGSLATEPGLDINDLPKLYIDTTTKEGMSGSPVYAYVNGMFWLEGEASMNPERAKMGISRKFLGIYSGRIDADPTDAFAAHLGIVWKEKAIRAIIEGKTMGDQQAP